MFEFIRTHSRVTLAFVLLLIIPSFVFFGFENYSSMSDGTNAEVAEVDGAKITRAEWDFAHQRNVERVRNQDPDSDVVALDSPAARQQSLEGLVRERLLRTAAEKLHLLPSDARVQRLFLSDEQFTSLRNADGSVNRDMLQAQGMTSEVFLQRLRQDLAQQQVVGGVARTVLLPPALAARALDALLEQREAEVQRFDPTTYRAQVNPSAADIEAYYKANEAEFRAPEQAQIEYVVLDLETLARDASVSDDELRKYYTENAARYTAAEERRASHILVKSDDSMSAADRKAARERAETLLAELRKAPASFAAIARRASEDEGSKAQGGDLDWFGRGGMTKPFEDAVYAMKSGEISNLIETEFGLHVISLTGVRGGEKKSFEAVRPEIETEVRRSLAQRRYVDAAEQFTNMVYEQSDSLRPVVERLNLPLRTATVQRTPAAGAAGALASPKLLSAVFGNDAVANKRNTDAVDIGPSQLAAARVVTYTPARTRPLAEVNDAARERLMARESARLAREAGERRVVELRARPTETLPIPLRVSRQAAQVQGLPKPLLDAVLGADASKLPTVTGLELESVGYLVVRIIRVLPREAAPGGDAALRMQVAQAWAGAEAELYIDALKQRYKAVVAPGAQAASEPAR